MPGDNQALQSRLDCHNFYHCIRLNSEVATKGFEDFRRLQEPVLRALEQLSLVGKRVLDIGCRDGLFCLAAERLGAVEVVGVDNDLSAGAMEVVLPYFRSRVKMHKLNLYDLTPEMFGLFDVVIFPGVLYHLRYPIWGLKRIRDVLAPGGTLIIETGVFVKHQELPLIYCPIDDESPYEPTSVTFFNPKGLKDTLSSLGIRVTKTELLGVDDCVDRGTFVCVFEPKTMHGNQTAYWERTHTLHTDIGPSSAGKVVKERSEVMYRREVESQTSC